ncbi:keratin-associated protein 7-1 [Ochotona curzoniae]|uniref:keratin-associated protein 7-1 n=1 Tax=Ochotona curzoniae TaxID=130825 RepID=UPI001B34FF38|nr:keratin-associated protein 7-1 [Ochotona curzoniae]
MTRYFCCGSYFPGYPCYGTNFHGTYRATPLNCVVPLGSPLQHGCYSSMAYGPCGNNFTNNMCYGRSFVRPWGHNSGFGYSTY